jgi:dihydroorotate dehydrogenase electron transfer subunit
LSAYHTASNQLRTTRVLKIEAESPAVKTFTFKDKECAKARPGQFLMLWIPSVDEIPLSILDAGKDGLVSVAVRKVGEATQALHKAKVGDLIGVRGPFGNSFTAARGKILMIAGGTGTAPLLFLAKKSVHTSARTVFILGAKTRKELLFMAQLDQMPSAKMQLITSTEDGSCGITGLCTEPLEHILARESFDIVYACGPEPMILKVFELADKCETKFEASLERLMRCAIGLCGSCAIGKYRVCRDGPIFNKAQLREVKNEFGISKRDFDGRKVPV